MLALESITEENFYQVIKLKVSPAQEKFVAPNQFSLAECYLYRANNDVFPYAITAEEKVVGFLLLDTDLETRELMIWRMMIDLKDQGKGYGKETIQRVIEWGKEQGHYDVLIADYVTGNQPMADLLERLGFVEQSFKEEFNEYVCHYDLRPSGKTKARA